MSKERLNHKVSLVRLNKFIANSGVCNRREADKLILDGEISVNGNLVNTLGTKVRLGTDSVTYNGRLLRGEALNYILLNKPKGYSVGGKKGKDVQELVRNASTEHIYPVGELNATDLGLVLFTNDQQVASRLEEKRIKHPSLYHVVLDSEINERDLLKLRKGLKLSKGNMKALEVAISESIGGKEIGIKPDIDSPSMLVELMAAVGYKVIKCDRVIYAGLTKKEIPRGKWRVLEPREIAFLQMATR